MFQNGKRTPFLFCIGVLLQMYNKDLPLDYEECGLYNLDREQYNTSIYYAWNWNFGEWCSKNPLWRRRVSQYSLYYWSVRRCLAVHYTKTGWDILIFIHSNSYTRRYWKHWSCWRDISHPRINVLGSIRRCIWRGRGQFIDHKGKIIYPHQ